MPYPSETLFPEDDRYPSDEDDEAASHGFVPYYLDELFKADSLADDDEVLELIAHFLEAVEYA
jgi:hypothetical protein